MGNFEEEVLERQKLKEAVYAGIFDYHTMLVIKNLYKDQASLEEGLKLAEEVAWRIANEKAH